MNASIPTNNSNDNIPEASDAEIVRHPLMFLRILARLAVSDEYREEMIIAIVLAVGALMYAVLLVARGDGHGGMWRRFVAR